MKDIVFISHANPEDNDFAWWLAAQLMNAGYKVWCDLENLIGGEDFWKDIENKIRDDTVKFLYVLSTVSNRKDGLLKELAVAQKVQREYDLKDFVIPLRIDNIPPTMINIELTRLNYIIFYENWASGLTNLLKKLSKNKVPKSNTINPDFVNVWWLKQRLKGMGTIDKSETYYSNWFPIMKLPDQIYFHPFRKSQLKHLLKPGIIRFPAFDYKHYMVSFVSTKDIITELQISKDNLTDKSPSYSIETVMHDKNNRMILSNNEMRYFTIRLLNQAWISTMFQKGLRPYKLSNERTCFWFEKGAVRNDRAGNRLIVGKHLDAHWHFAISANSKLYPLPCFSINTHIVFTYDGHQPFSNSLKQHRMRRRKGRTWWNSEWRDRLLGLLSLMADTNGNLKMKLGGGAHALIGTNPIQFTSDIGYDDPKQKQDIFDEKSNDEDISTEDEIDINEQE